MNRLLTFVSTFLSTNHAFGNKIMSYSIEIVQYFNGIYI